jgi:excisionase family DNA binding protein
MSSAAQRPRASDSERGGKRALPRLLNLQEVAEILGCSVRTVRRRIDDRELPSIPIGRLVRVHPDDLDRYIAERRGL